MYRTTLIIAFFSEYLSSSTLTVSTLAVDELFNTVLFVIPVLIILISILVLSILIIKKKPFVFYIINIFVYILVAIILNNSMSVVKDLTQHVVDLRTIKLARDLLLISIFGQFLTIIKTFVYATGFDIKKFNFGQDLAELEIEETDNEEFEVDISVDTNAIKRNLRKRVRFAKYVYIENKFLLNLIALLLVGISLLVIYFNQTIYNKAYNEGTTFITKDFTMRINRSFITKNNFKDEVVSHKGMSYVILEIDLKKNQIPKIKLEVARTQLTINEKTYYHIFGLNDLAPDIGNIYNDNGITDEFVRYLLVYEVPDEQLKNGVLQFKFLDTFGYSNKKWNAKYIKVNLKPRNLDEITQTKDHELGDEINFENSILGKTTIKLSNFNIKRQHKLNYKFCINREECYNSYEYIKPNIYNVTEKTIMYLKGVVNWDNDLSIMPIVDVYHFLNTFGTIDYEINGQTKQQKIELREVKPQKTKIPDDYYIEVMSEIEKADKIVITFNIRDIKFNYRLR